MVVVRVAKCELFLIGAVFFHDPDFAMVGDGFCFFVEVGARKNDGVGIGHEGLLGSGCCDGNLRGVGCFSKV